MLLFQTTDTALDGSVVRMVYVGPDIDSVRDYLVNDIFHDYNRGCQKYGLTPYTNDEMFAELSTLEPAGDWDSVLMDMDSDCLVDWRRELQRAIDNSEYPHFIGERNKTHIIDYAGDFN